MPPSKALIQTLPCLVDHGGGVAQRLAHAGRRPVLLAGRRVDAVQVAVGGVKQDALVRADDHGSGDVFAGDVFPEDLGFVVGLLQGEQAAADVQEDPAGGIDRRAYSAGAWLLPRRRAARERPRRIVLGGAAWSRRAAAGAGRPGGGAARLGRRGRCGATFAGLGRRGRGGLPRTGRRCRAGAAGGDGRPALGGADSRGGGRRPRGGRGAGGLTTGGAARRGRTDLGVRPARDAASRGGGREAGRADPAGPAAAGPADPAAPLAAADRCRGRRRNAGLVRPYAGWSRRHARLRRPRAAGLRRRHPGLLRPGAGRLLHRRPGCAGQPPGGCAGGIVGLRRPWARRLLLRHARWPGQPAGRLRHAGLRPGRRRLRGRHASLVGQAAGCAGHTGCWRRHARLGRPDRPLHRRHARLRRPGALGGRAIADQPEQADRLATALGATVRLGRPLNLETAIIALEGIHNQRTRS